MNSSVTKQPLISVIVPVYNIIPYLPRCVESLRTQTYENLEILLIDDGSTDETPALCDRLATGDERIRVFHKENGGPSSARNFGLQQAGGEYVGFVDSDDYVDADMYERLYGAIEKTGMPVAQVGRDEIDKDGNILPNICEPVATEQVIPAEDFLKELLMHRGDCSFCTKLLRKDLFTIMYFIVRTAIPETRTGSPGYSPTISTMRTWCLHWWIKNIRSCRKSHSGLGSSSGWIICCTSLSPR